MRFKETLIFDRDGYKHGDIIRMNFGNFSFCGVIERIGKSTIDLIVSFPSKAIEDKVGSRVKALGCDSDMDRFKICNENMSSVAIFHLCSYDISDELIKVERIGRNDV